MLPPCLAHVYKVYLSCHVSKAALLSHRTSALAVCRAPPLLDMPCFPLYQRTAICCQIILCAEVMFRKELSVHAGAGGGTVWVTG